MSVHIVYTAIIYHLKACSIQYTCETLTLQKIWVGQPDQSQNCHLSRQFKLQHNIVRVAIKSGFNQFDIDKY